MCFTHKERGVAVVARMSGTSSPEHFVSAPTTKDLATKKRLVSHNMESRARGAKRQVDFFKGEYIGYVGAQEDVRCDVWINELGW